MKLITKLSPKNIFRSKKHRSDVSRTSDPSSFSSGSTSSATAPEIGTPTSVLPGEVVDYYDLAHAFKLIDRDTEGGGVSRAKLEKLLSQLGAELPSQEEDESELLSRFGSVCNEPACVSELREVFDVFDSDRDGKISAEELLRFFTTTFGEDDDERCTLEDCRRMIAGVDKNGDGVVCFEDFALMMDLQT
ncbi:hypothetical protein ACFE04_030117 [Oxalis oulophora]